MTKPLIVTAAFPFVPSVLTTAHIASTYLPADVTARLLRMLGREARLATGMDVHSVQVSRDGKTRNGAAELCDQSERTYRALLNEWNITPDLWFRTDAPDHVTNTLQAFERLHVGGDLAVALVPSWICGGCEASIPRRLLVRRGDYTACPWCGTSSVSNQERPHYHFLIEPHRAAIVSGLSRFPITSRSWLAALTRQPFEPWCLTRDNHIGIRLQSNDHRSLYLWFDSLVGYLTIRERLAACEPTFATAGFLQFFGKNIVYHHGVIQPALLEALGEDAEVRASVRGFLQSSSDFTAGAGGCDARRLYLVAKTFDGPRDFKLSGEEFRAFYCKTVLGKIGNLLRRCALKVIRGRIDAEAGAYLQNRRRTAIESTLMRHANAGEPRLALMVVLEEVTALAREGHQERWLIEETPQARGASAGALAHLLTILAPFAPTAVEAFRVFAGWTPGALAEAGRALNCPIEGRTLCWPA
jgi:methionyl-tRNA synthetase